MSDPDLAMDDPRDSSSRFVIQSMVNIFVCNQAGKRFNAMILKQRAITPKSYLYFAIFAFTIISINQLLFFAFKTENLYEKINLPRKLSLSEVKKHGDELAIELMKKQMPADEKIRKINEISEIISVLSHPARRLTYDSFGLTSTQYAWAFKSQTFVVSSIISSSMFYVIFTFLNLINRSRTDMKQAFKIEMVVMIMLLLWEIDMILTAQNRLHQDSDLLDSIYFAFPRFERREMLKAILVPSMSIVQFFVRYYIKSDNEVKFISIANQPKLKQITVKIREKVHRIDIDIHLEDRLQVAFNEFSKTKEDKLKAQIYSLQRNVLKNLLTLYGDDILCRENVNMALHYFMLK